MPKTLNGIDHLLILSFLFILLFLSCIVMARAGSRSCIASVFMLIAKIKYFKKKGTNMKEINQYKEKTIEIVQLIIYILIIVSSIYILSSLLSASIIINAPQNIKQLSVFQSMTFAFMYMLIAFVKRASGVQCQIPIWINIIICIAITVTILLLYNHVSWIFTPTINFFVLVIQNIE